MRPVPSSLHAWRRRPRRSGQGLPTPSGGFPGSSEDGYTLLHSQWPIHPVGDQVVLGDFPVGMAD